MAEPVEKQLVASFCEAWNEAAPPLLGGETAVELLDFQESEGGGVEPALAVAATWPCGFVASCSGALSGVVICLFKSDDGNEIERLVKAAVDGSPKPGGRALIGAVLAWAAAGFAEEPVSFGDVAHVDFSGQEPRLAAIAGDKLWMGTISLKAGGSLDTQALLLYAPQGSEQALAAEIDPPAREASQAAAAGAASSALAMQPQVSRRAGMRDERKETRETDARNLDRLLGVELEVVVRFGSASMPLRDVVRLGTGMMIELNRAVDEPVELMVNGRLLARGEVVVVDGYYGVRITEIGAPGERPLSVILPGGQV
jgi:flagellar motor switch protein FliN